MTARAIRTYNRKGRFFAQEREKSALTPSQKSPILPASRIYPRGWVCIGNVATTKFLRTAKHTAVGMDADGPLRNTTRSARPAV
jgi:hypothetical protein